MEKGTRQVSVRWSVLRTILLIAGMAVAASLLGYPQFARAADWNYRIVDGQMTFDGSSKLTCSYPNGDCRDFDGGYRLGSKSEERSTDTTFSVHAPGEFTSGTSELGVYAPLDISSWTHEFKANERDSLTPCGSPTMREKVDSDLQHDGGTTPSVYEAAVQITPGAARQEFTIRLMPPEGTEPRFGGMWPTGLRWEDSTRYSTVLETNTATGHPDCAVGGTSREPMLHRAPFDFYPYTARTIQETPNTFGQPECDNVKCEVRVDGSTSWTYGSPYEGNTLDGSMTISWWLVVEINSGSLECSDGFSNDFDGIADYPLDLGCTDVSDPSELGTVECDNGIDDDGDGYTDWPADTNCPDIAGERELVPECEDGVSNDFDGLVDFPLDLGCSSPDDDELTGVQCDNGLDDDGDGEVDWPADTECQSASGTNELFDCRTSGKSVRANLQYKSRAVLNNMPDAHLFSFEPTVIYCYGAGRSEIYSANTWGFVDAGVDTGILEALGFTVDYTGGNAVKSGNLATFDGKFVVRFDVLSLSKRFGVGKVVHKKLRKTLTKRLATALKKYDSSSKFKSVYLKEVYKFRKAMISKYRKSAGRAISDSPRQLRLLLLKLAARMEKKLDAFLKKEFEQPAKSLVSSKEFSRMAADEMATAIVDGASQAISEKFTLEFPLWEPLVVVETHADGGMSQKHDGFANDILKIDYGVQAAAIP